MNLTLNEKLRFQKQAGIINESQYKKLLKEAEMASSGGTPINYKKLKDILLLASKTFPGGSEGALIEKEDIKWILQYLMNVETAVKNDDRDIFDDDDRLATFEGFVNLNKAQQAKWDDIDTALSVVNMSVDEYDLDDVASSLKELSKAINNFQLNTPVQEGYLNHKKDNYLDGVDGREFEKKEIKDWFKFAPICHILVNDNGKEYQKEFTDLNSALEFVDSLPETAQIML